MDSETAKGLSELATGNVGGKSDLLQAELIGVPLGIFDFLRKRKETRIQAVMGRYWVTDIVACQRKNYYKQVGVEQEELLGDATLERMWDAERGSLLHQITYAYRWRELDIEYLVPLRNGGTATVVGRLDGYDWRTKTIIDIKTTKFIKWQMRNGFLLKMEHILQLQCYYTLFSQRLPVEHLNLVYADESGMATYEIRRRNLVKWINARVQDMEDFVAGKQIPNGQVSSLCKYCPYQTRCQNDKNGLSEKPLSIPKTGSSSEQYY